MVVLRGGRLFMSEAPLNSLVVLGGGGGGLMSEVPMYSFASDWIIKRFLSTPTACYDCMFLL